MKKQVFFCWAIANQADEVLTRNKHGLEVWKAIPKKGIPEGTYDFGSAESARAEISRWHDIGQWPSMTCHPKKLSWS